MDIKDHHLSETALDAWLNDPITAIALRFLHNEYDQEYKEILDAARGAIAKSSNLTKTYARDLLTEQRRSAVYLHLFTNLVRGVIEVGDAASNETKEKLAVLLLQARLDQKNPDLIIKEIENVNQCS